MMRKYKIYCMSPVRLRSVSLSEMLRMALLILCVLFFIGYGLFQARNLIQGPSITLLESLPRVSADRAVVLHGTARNTTALYVNGQEILTDEKGAFSHTLVLENGYTIVTLTGHDRYGRVTTVTRGLVYAPAPS